MVIPVRVVPERGGPTAGLSRRAGGRIRGGADPAAPSIGGRAGYPVQWAAFDNGHMPGPADGTYAESGVTTWTKAEVWRFFAQFS
jgi:hypothetical protein